MRCSKSLRDMVTKEFEEVVALMGTLGVVGTVLPLAGLALVVDVVVSCLAHSGFPCLCTSSPPNAMRFNGSQQKQSSLDL